MGSTTLTKITSNPDELREFANTLERASFYMMISFKDICTHESIGKILSCYEDLQLLRDGLLEEYHLSADRQAKSEPMIHAHNPHFLTAQTDLFIPELQLLIIKILAK